MKMLIGWLFGLATAWATLAIWQRLPEFPDIDDEPPLAAAPTVSEEWKRRHHPEMFEEKPYVHLNNKFPPPPVTDPGVHINVGHS